MTSTYSASETYTHTDIATVIKRFTADIVMIAQSSDAITKQKARQYAQDVEELAINGYIKKVDLTLFGGGAALRAAQYTVNTSSGELSMSRPAA